MPGSCFPLSTYRLQFNRHFTFAYAARVIPYLANLGISDCYASPYLQACPGSLHGYDVVDPTRLNVEIGSAADYQTFVDALNVHQMGQILDLVPNHMNVTGSWNPWWQDVLENGPGSRYSRFFDINWVPVKPELKGKILLPILGDQYGLVLENGEITLCYHEGRFFIRYYEHQLPIDPSDYVLILKHRFDLLLERDGTEAPPVQELQRVTTALLNLPGRNDPDPEQITIRYREKETLKRRLAALTDDDPTVKNFVQENLRAFNGTKGDPQSFNLLDFLLQNQAYRLAFWRVAGEEINYRRFFDVNELAAIRIEDPDVFQDVHQFIFPLLQSAAVHGLRVDHVDGLYEPKRYLEHWQEWAQKELGLPADARGRSLYVVVEKILGKGERLSEDWPVHGTTGYEFLHLLNNLFVDSHNKRAMDALYTQFARDTTTFETLAYECKNLIMDTSMSSELNALGHQLNLLSEKRRHSRDFTLNSLTRALKEIIACFPVYRTYVSPREHEGINDQDQACLRLAVIQAKRRNPATGSQVFDFVLDLLLRTRVSHGTLPWEDVQPFVMKFQQTTGAVMAKGLEDTAFYLYNRLISLNEVGGEPTQFGISVTAFHERMQERHRHWPLSLSTTSTHDTKRSEDVRARVQVLSEMPGTWKTRVRRWHRLNKKQKTRLNGQDVPSRNEEYLLYQTLLGAWPFVDLDSRTYQDFRQRIQDYTLKALKEAKVHTSWINPNAVYEQAVSRFIQKILEPGSSNQFLTDFLPFQKTIARYGMYNALSQVVLKIGCPGTPDFYQGTEVWDFTLVDPDNRRPIDYDHLHNLARTIPADGAAMTETYLRHMLESYEDGRIKFYVTRALLNYRKANPALFQQGTYEPLETTGEKRHYLCAFQRTWKTHAAIVVVPRLIHGIIPDSTVPALGRNAWGETGVAVPNGNRTTRYRHVLTNQKILARGHEGNALLAVSEIFQQLPVAMMERIP